jgi:hypothetical protein
MGDASGQARLRLGVGFYAQRGGDAGIMPLPGGRVVAPGCVDVATVRGNAISVDGFVRLATSGGGQ